MKPSFFLFTLCLLTSDLVLSSDKATYANWEISEIGIGVRYITHGEKVYGHKFGFIKKYGYCGHDILWVSLSTSDNSIAQHKGKTVALSISTDSTVSSLEPTLLTAGAFGPLFNIAIFTNAIVNPELKNQLISAQRISLTVSTPNEVVKLFDINPEAFSLAGLSTSMAEATDRCLTKGVPRD